MKKFLLLSLFSLTALAYIPSTNFIFDRVADLHGKGNYKISFDVTFKEGADTQVVKEVWIVSENGDMFVQAYGGNFKLTRLIKKNKVYWQPEASSQLIQDLSSDSYMPILFMRSPSELKRLFVRWGALPLDSLKEKKAPKELADIKTETEPWARLGRVNGAVQYAYGEPDKSGVWIEQNNFFISKMRMPSGAEFIGQDYLVYSKNLAFPKNQIIRFGNSEVEIKVTGVSAVENLSKDDKAKLEPSFLKTKPDYSTTWPKISLANTMLEFYKRFR